MTMFIPILYFLAAGALAVGGPASAAVLFRRGGQLAAAELRATDVEAVKRLLRAEIDAESLRKEARLQGIDPDLVEKGYQRLRDGNLTFDQVSRFLRGELP